MFSSGLSQITNILHHHWTLEVKKDGVSRVSEVSKKETESDLSEGTTRSICAVSTVAVRFEVL